MAGNSNFKQFFGPSSQARNVPGAKSQQVVATNIPPPRMLSPPRPEKVSRVRANSMSTPSSSPKATRKRTSSGVFQVDDSEQPPPKKTEHTRTLSEGALKTQKIVSNGRRKVSETSENEAKEQKRIIDRFDNNAKTTCVSAFKESDSWD